MTFDIFKCHPVAFEYQLQKQNTNIYFYNISRLPIAYSDTTKIYNIISDKKN